MMKMEKKNEMKNEDNEQNGYIFVPEMSEFFEKKRENVALVWISVQCSILFRDEFQDLRTPTKYIYLAIMLTCGLRGTNELPFNIKYLARIAGVNRRAMSKAVDELLCADMLTKRERKKERKEKKSTDSTDRKNENGVLGVDNLNLFQNEEKNENGLLKNETPAASANEKIKHSQFTIEECLKYVEHCRIEGDSIQSPKALATHLFKTGEADSFILAALYPEKQTVLDIAAYGLPRGFTDEPCAVCFGAKMEVVQGKGAKPCQHCKNEKGKSIGLEPQGEN